MLMDDFVDVEPSSVPMPAGWLDQVQSAGHHAARQKQLLGFLMFCSGVGVNKIARNLDTVPSAVWVWCRECEWKALRKQFRARLETSYAEGMRELVVREGLGIVESQFEVAKTLYDKLEEQTKREDLTTEELLTLTSALRQASLSWAQRAWSGLALAGATGRAAGRGPRLRPPPGRARARSRARPWRGSRTPLVHRYVASRA